MASKSLVWLITGTNGGFGLELALLALHNGHTVVGTARSLAKVPSELKDAGADLVETNIDAPETAIKAIVDDIVTKYGRIDVVVNNAGYIQSGAIEELSFKQIRNQMDVNFFGSLSFAQAALPHMRKQKSGIIVQLSSLAGIVSHGYYGMYSASKYALEAAFEALYGEVKPFGVRIHIIEPGYFRTNFLSRYNKADGNTEPENRISEYSDMSAVLSGVDHKQPGDPKKGMLRLYEIITATGMGAGKEDVLRIPLGSDVHQYAIEKYKAELANVEKLKELSCSTDF
jgi:NAD(P)-dependent dehydrogenase (short-subunit alcohol dehydrogenase family)